MYSAGVISVCYPTPMCGRYTLAIDKSTIKKHFGAKFYIAKVATTTKPPTNRALADAVRVESSRRACVDASHREGLAGFQSYAVRLFALPDRAPLVVAVGEHETVTAVGMNLRALASPPRSRGGR